MYPVLSHLQKRLPNDLIIQMCELLGYPESSEILKLCVIEDVQAEYYSNDIVNKSIIDLSIINFPLEISQSLQQWKFPRLN